MKIAIITGASSGMGKEFALLLDQGLKNIDEFWLMARNEERLTALSARLHHKTRIFAGDVTDPNYLQSAADLADEMNARICMLILCAGVGYMGDFEEIPATKHQEVIRLNCEALTRSVALFLPYMHQNARIITLVSSSAFLPQPGFATYAASKAYAYNFSRALSQELRSRGIYVTTVCPGPVDTPFLRTASQTGESMALKKYFTANPRSVVIKALEDSARKRPVSIFGFSMKAFSVIVKVLPEALFLDAVTMLRKN